MGGGNTMGQGQGALDEDIGGGAGGYIFCSFDVDDVGDDIEWTQEPEPAPEGAGSSAQ